MRIALAQLNPTVGDVAGNTRMVLDAIEVARRDAADVLLCPELVLIGYPPRDLLFRDSVVEACEAAVKVITEHAGEIAVIVGHPRSARGGTRPLYNSVSVCRDGDVIARCDKQLLPGYDVFDEDRYFEPGNQPCLMQIDGRKVGLLICEDLWRANDVQIHRDYHANPIQNLLNQNCDVLLCPNASPFVMGKWRRHVNTTSTLALESGVSIAVVNQVGANDDLIFDGRSFLIGSDGQPRAILPGWSQCVTTIDLEDAPSRDAVSREIEHAADSMGELFSALVLGVQDYVRKTSHHRVLIGLSGGIDSALTATIAIAAVGSGNVSGLLMPSKYSSEGSVTDAKKLIDNLGITEADTIGIHGMHDAIRDALQPVLGNKMEGLPDENAQARLRGMILMAVSNATGSLVLATGNKSELAVGYSTLYGDMCGAVSVLGDVLKTQVYELSRWINDNYAACGFANSPIPKASITKPPSAELRPNQTDQDTLAPYEMLDQIIERHVENEQSIAQIVEETGYETALVKDTVQAIDRAQYKREQASVILKISPRAFGRGRSMPIAMHQTGISDLPSMPKSASPEACIPQVQAEI